MTRESADRLADLIEQADWDVLTRRLLAFTLHRLSMFHGRGVSQSVDAHDYVVRAVEIVLADDLSSPPDSNRSLFATLATIIDHLIRSDYEYEQPDAK